jgi:cation:H+ antiporter
MTLDTTVIGWTPGSVTVAAATLAVAVAFIGVAGTRLARVVDRLADRSGIGEAVAGAVLLGGSTSLAGLIVSVVAAAEGHASLAVSNSIGGIAAQTALIVIADMFYRRENLEHAAASLGNVFNSLLLLMLLAIVVLGATAPDVTVLGVSPVTVLLVGTYWYGTVLVARVQKDPMWEPRVTSETRPDTPDPEAVDGSLRVMAGQFAILAFVVLVAGYLVARSGTALMAQTGLSGTVVGAFVTSVATSLPELVTSVAAVRAGAVTLAVGGIVGGNAFDLLFVAAADVTYREGSVYSELAQADLFVVGWAMLLVGILAAGLVRRQRRGIGFEGVSVLLVYLVGLAVVTTVW